MTVNSKVKQTAASLKGTQATLAMYDQITQQESEKHVFNCDPVFEHKDLF